MVIREQPKLYTVEEFWMFTELPENQDRRFELDSGAIVDIAYASPVNTVTAGHLIYFVGAYVMPRDLGWVMAANGWVQVDDNTIRQPNAAFISKARSPEMPADFALVPDLAVEVVSPSEDVFKKVNEYLNAGVKLVWTVYPDEKTIYVFRKEADGELRVRAYGVDDTLDGSDVLPGFTLKVGMCFLNNQ